MEVLWQNLKQFWANQSIKVGRPVSLAEIEQFEAAHQIILPLDFKSYLLEVNGMNDEAWETDDNLICFWSLRNIKSLIEEYSDWAEGIEHANEYFIFADYSIRCHDFAVRAMAGKTDTAPVYVLYDQPQQVASSFAEFIERYIARDTEMTFPQPV